MSVLGLVHRNAEKYIKFDIPPKNKHIAFHRDRLITALNSCNANINSWSNKDLFFNISKLCGPVLMSNHSRNAQYKRLYEKKAVRVKVAGPETFPGFCINWDLVEMYIRNFRKDHRIFAIRWFKINLRQMKRKPKIYSYRLYKKLLGSG